MTAITNSSQLNTFSLVRDILLTNSVLNTKFSTNDYYEFEPKHKSQSFRGYPYIIVEVPFTDDSANFLGVRTTDKLFTVTITLVVEYDARSNVNSYASNIMSALSGATDTFFKNGYAFQRSNVVIQPEVTSVEEKSVVITEVEVELRGEVKW